MKEKEKELVFDKKRGKASLDFSALHMLAEIMGLNPHLFIFDMPKPLERMARVMNQFKQFKDDFAFLWEKEIITAEGENFFISKESLDNYTFKLNFKWNLSKACLAQYFVNLEKDTSETIYFWEPIESAFSLKKGSLKHYVNIGGYEQNAKDYDELMDLLTKHRELNLNNDTNKLLAIKDLITDFEDSDETWKNDDIHFMFSNLFEDIKKVING